MMTRKFQISFFVLGLCSLAISAAAQNQELTVVIDNVKDGQGTIWVALHKPDEEYMKTRFMWIKLTPQKGIVTGVFKDVPPGYYGISVMHDANNNKELDKNGIGIPIEGFGFSNNALGRFGPPEFKKVAFEFPMQKEAVIKMRYM